MDTSMPSQIFPELTPSEIEICRLVILGKGLKEVCRELSKVESNITSQRRHIRIKLGLQPSDNLKKSFWQDSTKWKTADGTCRAASRYVRWKSWLIHPKILVICCHYIRINSWFMDKFGCRNVPHKGEPKPLSAQIFNWRTYVGHFIVNEQETVMPLLNRFISIGGYWSLWRSTPSWNWLLTHWV